MATPNIDLVGLDFTSLKNNFKAFLQSKTQFKDIDFEGSNINVLMDILAYNTYLNSYYVNMVASEMFLDTAQQRDSIVSHAKELNYLPRSFNSSKASVSLKITPNSSVIANTLNVLVPQYTSFTTRLGSNTYTFTTQETIVLTDSTNGFFTANVDLYEGIVSGEAFVVNYANTTQRFVLSNQTVDTSSVTVTVYEDSGESVLLYTKGNQLFNLTANSQVFFIQPAENKQYEITFSDGHYGRTPKDGSTVVVKYRACSGELPNGATKFATDGAIDGHSNVAITVITPSRGGAVAETDISIKFNAPKAFQSQYRAVTARDYETLLTTQFADIQSMTVYGGEEADPPQFGKVFIAVDVANADGAALSRKQDFATYLQDKTPLTIDTVFVDPEFMYAKITSTVTYDVNKTRKTAADIKTLAQAAISTFNNTYLQKFKSSLTYSQFIKAIDAADQSIVGNDTSIVMAKRIIPTLNAAYSAVIQTYNRLQTETGVVLQVSEKHYGHTITSSAFTHNGNRCILVDDTLGTLWVAVLQNNVVRITSRAGTVNYATGVIRIQSLVISNYEGNYLEIRARALSKNVVGNKNIILQIDPLDVSVTVVPVRL
jgi:hypothetical protein